MDFVVIDVEFVERNVVKEMGLYFDGNILGLSFKPPRDYEPTKQAFWGTDFLHGMSWDSGKLDYDSLQRHLQIVKKHKSRFLAKGTEKCKIVSKLLGADVENLEEYGCPKIQQLARPNHECSNYPLKHEHSLHCAEKKARAFGEWFKERLAL